MYKVQLVGQKKATKKENVVTTLAYGLNPSRKQSQRRLQEKATISSEEYPEANKLV